MNIAPYFLLTALAAHAQVTPASISTGHSHDHAHAVSDAGVVYTCSMHPEVQSPTPGKCPKCGMKLTPKAALAPERRRA